MSNRRPTRKFAQQRPQRPASVTALPVPVAAPAWAPPVPRNVALLGTEQHAAFVRLGEASADLAAAKSRLHASVVAARSEGVSWSVIAHAVGVTTEAARQRWRYAA